MVSTSLIQAAVALLASDASLDLKYQVKHFLHSVTLSSRMGGLPDAASLALLHDTVKGPMTVYRGISIPSLTRAERVEANSLKVGDDIPEHYRLPNGNQTVIHTTTSKSVANGYASGGELSLVMAFEVSPSAIICDTNNLKAVLDKGDLSPDDWTYFKEAKEVMLFKDAKLKPPTVVSVKVR